MNCFTFIDYQSEKNFDVDLSSALLELFRIIVAFTTAMNPVAS